MYVSGMSKLLPFRFFFLGIGVWSLFTVPAYLTGVLVPKPECPWALPLWMVIQVTSLFTGVVLVIRARFDR